jgi:hypothetical protein
MSFRGLWLFPFGLLVWRSGFIPCILGLFVACFGYLTFGFTRLLMPQYLNTVARIANIAILGEAPIVLWLVVMGAKPGPPGAPQPRHPRLVREPPGIRPNVSLRGLLAKAGVRRLWYIWPLI